MAGHQIRGALQRKQTGGRALYDAASRLYMLPPLWLTEEGKEDPQEGGRSARMRAVAAGRRGWDPLSLNARRGELRVSAQACFLLGSCAA